LQTTNKTTLIESKTLFFFLKASPFAHDFCMLAS